LNPLYIGSNPVVLKGCNLTGESSTDNRKGGGSNPLTLMKGCSPKVKVLVCRVEDTGSNPVAQGHSFNGNNRFASGRYGFKSRCLHKW
jgi:hypothetical protein